MTEIENFPNKRMSYQRLQPERQISILPRWKLLLHKFDLFSVIPSPQTYPVSTKKSLIGTFIFIFLFATYLISSFIFFIIGNVPRLNEYTRLDDSTSITKGPDIAIQFLYGNPFSDSITNNSIFNFSMQQVIKYLDPTKADNTSKQIPLKICYSKDIDWMPKNASHLAFLCPMIPLNLSGQLYQSEEFIYPRIQIDYCPFKDPEKQIKCNTEDDIKRITAGGRLFLYIKSQAPDVNYVTGKETNALKYQVFQYYLIPGLYNRAEIVLQKQSVSITGDYFTQFKTKHEEFLTVNKQFFYVTNTTQNDVQNKTDSSIYKGFQVYLRLDQEVKIIQVVKLTIIDIVAKWGAFYSVIIGVFALYFLNYNQKKFYEKNKQWAVFDQKQTLFRRQIYEVTEIKTQQD